MSAQTAATEYSIKEMRRITGLSQSEFGKYLYGIPLRTIQDWENGHRNPTPYLLLLIRDKLISDGYLQK